MKLDKMIHRDEYRLRLLLTNSCDRACSYCLNDFQPKPREDGAKYLSTIIALNAVRSYVSVCESMGVDPIISISGGEPGLHPNLHEIVEKTVLTGAHVQINTNGRAWEQLQDFDGKLDWRFGTDVTRPELVTPAQRTGGTIQLVADEESLQPGGRVDEAVRFYSAYRIPVKIFSDFRSTDPELSQKVADYIDRVANDRLILSKLTTRFTGHQVNRGPLCNGCPERCITLKAMWVFPDGSVSPCPQRRAKPLLMEGARDLDWVSVMRSGYIMHKT